MKKQFSRIISLILTAVIICTMTGVPSFAQYDGPSTGLNVVTSLNLVGESSTIDKLATDGWKWVPGVSGDELIGGTLTLKNVYINSDSDSAISLPGDSTIVLSDGSINTINLPVKNSLTGIKAENLEINGKGTLNIDGSEIHEYIDNIGINAQTLKITDSTINISLCDYGIDVVDKVTIGDKAKLSINNSDNGISAVNNTISETGSTVDINVDNTAVSSYYVTINGSFIVNSNEGGVDAYYSLAIGGNLNINALGYAICSHDIVSTKESTITLKSNKLFLYAVSNINFAGNTIIENGSILKVDYLFTNSGVLTNNGLLIIEYGAEFKNTGIWNGNKYFYYFGDKAPNVADFTAKKARIEPIDLTQETEIDGNPLNVIDKLSTEGWKWDPANGGTLTLKNFFSIAYGFAIKLPSGAKLLSEDSSNNYITVEGGKSLAKTKYGPSIYSDGSITIGGSGTLNINSGDYAIFSKTGNIDIKGGNINIISKDGGIYTAQGNVNIAGGKINIITPGEGITCLGNVSITSGTVNITSGGSSLLVSGNMQITGGDITAVCLYSMAAIMVGSDDLMFSSNSVIKISGGTVKAKNITDVAGIGILVFGKGIEVTGGTVTVESVVLPAIAAFTVGMSQTFIISGMDTIPSTAVVKTIEMSDETSSLSISTFTNGGEFTFADGEMFKGDCLTKIKLISQSTSDSDDSTPITQVPSKTITVVEAPASMQGDTSLVTVNASNNAFNQSVEFKIKDDLNAKEAVEAAIKDSKVTLPKDTKLLPFDISVYIKSTETKVQPNAGETVEISCPVPTELLADKDSIVVVCVVDGKLQVLPTKIVEKDGKYFVVFTASHFSPYAFVVDKDKKLTTTTKGNPSTGVN